MNLRVLALLAAAGLFALTSSCQSAYAAEVYRGTISVVDAGVSHNLALIDGGAFAIPAFSRITVQPTAAAYVCVEDLASGGAPQCSSTRGVKVAQDEKFPSSCQRSHTSLMPDGGLVSGCVVAVMPSGTAAVHATVWTRGEDGAPNEGR